MSTPRKWADLRPSEKAAPLRMAPDDEPPELVLRRLFLTSPDGLKALAHMRSMVNQPLPAGSSNRALREAEGARSFVHKIDTLLQAKASDVPDRP